MNIDRHQRTVNYNNSVCERLLEFANKELLLNISSEPLDWACDMDSPWGLNFGGVTLFANEDFTEYEVGHETYDSGSYWEPPSSDYAKDSTHKDFTSAMWAVINLWVQYRYQNWAESRMAEAYEDVEVDFSDFQD